MESADTTDLKSVARKRVRVQVPPGPLYLLVVTGRERPAAIPANQLIGGDFDFSATIDAGLIDLAHWLIGPSAATEAS